MTEPIEKQTPPEGTQTVPPTVETPETPEEGIVQTPPSPEVPPEEVVPTVPEQDVAEVPPKPEVPEVTPETTPPAEVVPPVDYKQKFASSTRENQIITGKLSELQKELGDLTSEDLPTDEEMTVADPDWHTRSDYEKNLAIKVEASTRMQRRIAHSVSSFVKKSEKVTEISQVIEKDERLQGKETEFYEFVDSPKNANVPLDVLVNAFLFDANVVPTSAVETPPEEIIPTPEGVPPTLGRSTPSGGTPPVIKKQGEHSPEELKHLRTTNPKKYNQMIQRGEIQ